ncbi:uncharacterized protein [Anabrus simplex]|uniref:uncharacterized protein n=1 Tax=Anabrus simplex TaxID=316456 RepID=UPI0035A3A55C
MNLPLAKNGRIIGKPLHYTDRCSSRIEATMENMRNRQKYQASAPLSTKTSSLDLEGYALHQPLRTAPYDMYVTSMQVKIPATNNWYRIEQCYFDPRNKSLDTRLSFQDMSVSGIVKLYDENAVLHDPLLPLPADICNMTLRLRKAGLGITATPKHIGRGPIEIHTVSQFIEPEFVSVYAYGCRPSPRAEHRAATDGDDGAMPAEGRQNAKGRYVSEFTQEMEDVFVKGIQSLLATFMEKQLQTALKEAMMLSMGYTISYGK